MRTRPIQEWTARIAIDDKILTGKPVIKGARLAVEFIIELLACGWSEAEILENYPGVELRISEHVSLMQARHCTPKRFTHLRRG